MSLRTNSHTTLQIQLLTAQGKVWSRGSSVVVLVLVVAVVVLVLVLALVLVLLLALVGAGP